MRFWKYAGQAAYWLTWPLIYIYSRIGKPRARVIVVYENQVLLVKNWLGPGNWALPGGGLEHGETPVQAACRELEEEVSLKIPSEDMTYHGRYTFKGRGGMLVKYELCSTSVSTKPELRFKKDEIMDGCWIDVSDAMSPRKDVSLSVSSAMQTWSRSQNLV